MSESLKPEDCGYSEDLLTSVLTRHLGTSDFKLEGVAWKPASKKGDNFLGALFAISPTFTLNGGKETLDFVIKFPPFAPEIQAVTETFQVFPREIYFYKTMKPKLENFQKEYDICPASIPAPGYIDSSNEPGKEWICMENIKTAGFVLGNRKTGLDLAHCNLVLKAMAHFHAISIAMLDKGHDFTEELRSFSWENFLLTMLPQSSALVSASVDILRSVGVSENVLKKAEMLREKSRDLMQQIYLETDGHWSGLLHGDNTVSNILFRYDKDNRPVDLRLVDFQLIRKSSVVIDVVSFLYSSTTSKVRQDRLNDLLSTYHSSLMERLELFGVDCSELNFQALQEEFFKLQPQGFALALTLLPVFFNDSDEELDLADIFESKYSGSSKGADLKARLALAFAEELSQSDLEE